MIAILLAATLRTVTVPENYAVPRGRKIELKVQVVPGKGHHDDPIFVLAGGPGQAATTLEAFASRTFAESGRDLVFVDARGTGGSNALHCDFGGPFTGFLPPQFIEPCRDALAPRADLTQYTTANIVRDIDEVRRALGYRKIDLYGTSYGTRVAIEYMRRHPRNVRAAILDGVVPPSLFSSEKFAAGAEKTLDRVLALCESDEACRSKYPQIRADYRTMLDAARNGIDIDASGERVHVDRGLFGETLRNYLYSPEVYVRLPHVIHLAAQGDWTPFAETAIRYTRAIRTLDAGMFLSVTCAEDIPFLDAQKAREAARGTFLGAYRVDQQVDACRVWPRGAVNASLHKPLVSRIPTLIVSGELDPVTPPAYGDEVARTLRNALHVVIRYGSHSGDTGGCQEKVLSEFIRESSAKKLERACFAAMKRPSFE